MSDPARTTRTGEQLYTLDEAAAKLSVPIGTLYSWKSRRRLTAVAVGPGGKALFRLSEIEKLASTTRRRGSRHA